MQVVSVFFTVNSFQKIVMSIFFLVTFTAVTHAVPPDDGSKNHDQDQRSIGEYRRDVKTFKTLSKSDELQVRRNAVFNLCELHVELVSDSRFVTSSQIQGFRSVVARRLMAYARDFKKQELRKQRLAKKERGKLNSSRAESFKVDGFNVDTFSSDAGDSDLRNAGGDSTISGFHEPGSESEALLAASNESYNSIGQIGGGPNQLFSYAGGRFAPPWDHGFELVDLIENTINPAVWRSNGGNSVAHYFRPQRVLVISASSRTHDDVQDLLRKLGAGN